MYGYDADFLGSNFRLPLPTFSKELEKRILSNKERPQTDFSNGYYTGYVNYSLATNKERRQPVVVALNINQALIKSVSRGSWKLDPQVGPFQLGNSYYRRNVYDRGHLARRSAAAWGRTEEEAKAASDATMYYSNACLQHENFNQDEWLELEDWVKYLQDDVNDRVSVFSGPIYTRRDGTAKMIGSPRAEIPTAFFKVVCFVNKKGDLATVAFIMAQDAKAISDKNAKNRNFDRNTYQVSVKMIEDETGLLFDQRVKEANPIPYSPPPMSRDNTMYPVIAPVFEGELQVDDTVPKKATYKTGVGILAAMVNAEGYESRNEWVTIANFSSNDINLAGWTLGDKKRIPLQLSGVLRPGETNRFDKLYDASNNTGVILSSDKGTITLANAKGDIVDRVNYTTRNLHIQGVPLTFHLDEHISNDGMMISH